MKKLFLINIVIFLVLVSSRVMAAEDLSKVVVFGIPQRYPLLNALSIETINNFNNTFNELGRFAPVEQNQLKAALNKSYGAKSDVEYYSAVSSDMKVDIFIVIAVYQQADILYGEMKVFSQNKNYKNLEKKVVVRSKIKNNISLLLTKEVIKLHEDLEIYAKIKKTAQPGIFKLNAGEWHGLKNKSYNLKESGSIEILQTNRYSSFVKMHNTKKKQFTIKLTPGISSKIKNIDAIIEDNIIDKYSIEKKHLKGVESEKKLMEGLCIVNPGSNICLPVYGSYLSTYYMGFENAKPDNYTLWVSGLLYSSQLLYVPVATRFKANFFPWEQDGDKSDSMQDVHILLWATIPFTISVTYLDQLAYQFQRESVLPPLFEDRNYMAGFLSVLIPGGGFFYKGHRLYGWGYYVSELGLALYGVKNRKEDKGKYALYALGAVKGIEILSSIIIDPGYDFFSNEYKRERTTSVSFGMIPTKSGSDLCYTFQINYSFN